MDISCSDTAAFPVSSNESNSFRYRVLKSKINYQLTQVKTSVIITSVQQIRSFHWTARSLSQIIQDRKRASYNKNRLKTLGNSRVPTIFTIQGSKKVINKYQCGNDLHFSPLLNNADKYARFDDPNCNCWSCIYLDSDLMTLTFDLLTSGL